MKDKEEFKVRQTNLNPEVNNKPKPKPNYKPINYLLIVNTYVHKYDQTVEIYLVSISKAVIK